MRARSSKKAFLLALLVFFPLTTILAQEATSAPPTPSTPAIANDTGTVIRDEWTVVTIKGKRCGFGHSIVREQITPGGKQFLTENHQEFKFQRQGQNVRLVTRSVVVETAEGSVIQFQNESSGAGSKQITRGQRVGAEMVITDGTLQRRIPLDPKALGPEAFDRQIRALKLAPRSTFSALTFNADFPQLAVTTTVVVAGKEKRLLRNESRDLWKLVMTTNLLPNMETLSYFDDASEPQLAVMLIPGIGELEMVRSTRADAMKQLDSFEVFTSSLIVPKQPLPNVAQLKSATLRLTTLSSREPLLFWSGPGQTLVESKPGQTTVRVTLPHFDENTPEWKLPHSADAALKTYLEPSSYIEQTPRLVALAQQAVGDEKNPFLAARKIQRFVRAYIQNPDLSVGFATADETAVSRRGDCTEYAVLCAALGRAVGLPTRVVAGLAYLPATPAQPQDKFGFHMWAEAWLGPDQWQPMDAALSRYDVGHIALVKSALPDVDPRVELFLPIAQVMHDLQIEVLNTQ